jgi:hypothetical protein
MGFDPAPFCAAPMPNQKRRLPIRPPLGGSQGPRAVLAPAEWSRWTTASPPSRMGRASALQANYVRRARFHCSSLSLCQDNCHHGSAKRLFGAD